MKKIIILGADHCTTCKKLHQRIDKWINKYDLDAKVEKITDIKKIMKYDIMTTPAIVIDEDLKCSGRNPKKREFLRWIKE